MDNQTSDVMGTRQEAEARFMAACDKWIELRQPLMANAAAHKKRDISEHEARFQLANAAIHLAWFTRQESTMDSPTDAAVGARFYLDHGMIHDRKTGKHVTTDDDSVFCDGRVACCVLLNELADIATRQPGPEDVERIIETVWPYLRTAEPRVKKGIAVYDSACDCAREIIALYPALSAFARAPTRSALDSALDPMLGNTGVRKAVVDAVLGLFENARRPLTEVDIDFYEREFYPLSNFSSFTLMWETSPRDGLQRFDTSEAVYHWEKFKGNVPTLKQSEIQRAIRSAPSAHEAFKIAERNRQYRRPKWDDEKVDVMRKIIRAKAEQHEYVRRKLLETGDRPLIEGSWRDDFWGIGPNQDGNNMLGKLWMELRAALRASAIPKPEAVDWVKIAKDRSHTSEERYSSAEVINGLCEQIAALRAGGV